MTETRMKEESNEREGEMRQRNRSSPRLIPYSANPSVISNYKLTALAPPGDLRFALDQATPWISSLLGAAPQTPALFSQTVLTLQC